MDRRRHIDTVTGVDRRRHVATDLDRAVRVAEQLESDRSEEHTSELQSHSDIVYRLLLEKQSERATRVRAQSRRARIDDHVLVRAVTDIRCRAFVLFTTLRPPTSTLFPYTTLFRSRHIDTVTGVDRRRHVATDLDRAVRVAEQLESD